ncbi:hypothetical protein GALMADRAFT_252190 [Galerina marginata CBS 339.88]|uniref:DUF6533 domain-containing protein n=1 Tax=Galerina marginata (strain CBS 339.88) TaxID=685588 RepID=A0A067T1H4_GALM3|nr:hypothetical protein GALMADRAFT_252190 [Galerina marginata CBS 339.88]
MSLTGGSLFLHARYIGAAGLVFLFYDHILSFADEVEYVWKARWTLPKVLFLLVRYAVPSALLLHLYQLAASRHGNPDTVCQVWFNLGVCIGIFSMGAGNFLVLLRLWVIWNRNRRLMLSSFGLFLLAQVTVVICAAIVLVRITPSLSYDIPLKLCTLKRRSILGTLYAPALIFDSVALLSVCWNALSRRRTKQSMSAQYLYHDRFMYILLLFRKCQCPSVLRIDDQERSDLISNVSIISVMRLINFLITFFGPLHLVFLGICFMWATTTVTVSRLILDLRKNPGRPSDGTECERLNTEREI